MPPSIARKITRPQLTLDLPRLTPDAEGRISPSDLDHYTRSIQQWARDVQRYIDAKVPLIASFTTAAGFPIPNGGTATTDVTNIIEDIPNPDLRYTIDDTTGIITLPIAGIYKVSLNGSYSVNTTGSTRLVAIRSSSGVIVAPSAPPTSSGGFGMHLGASRSIITRELETLQVQGRQNSGGDLNLNVRLTLEYYGLPPV